MTKRGCFLNFENYLRKLFHYTNGLTRNLIPGNAFAFLYGWRHMNGSTFCFKTSHIFDSLFIVHTNEYILDCVQMYQELMS